MLSVTAARTSSPREFGAFALVLLAWMLALGLIRSLSTEPLIVRHAHLAGDSISAQRSSLRLSALIGVTCSAVFLTAALVIPEMAAELVALALGAPFLAVADGLRYCFFTAGRPDRSAACDGLWIVVQASVWVLWFQHDGASGAMWAWIAGGALSAGTMMWRTSLWPAGVGALQWLRDNWSLSSRFSYEFVANSGSAYLLTYLLGLVLGVASIGALQGAQLLFGPLNVIFMGSVAWLTPELSRTRHDDRERGLDLARVNMLLLGGAAVALTVVLVLLPDGIGEALLGDTWSSAHRLVVPLGLATVASSATMTYGCLLRAAEAASTSLRLRLKGVPLLAVCGLGGAIGGDVLTAAWAMSFGYLLLATLWRRAGHEAWTELGTTGALT